MLKKYLLGLFVGFVGFISFGNCDFIYYTEIFLGAGLSQNVSKGYCVRTTTTCSRSFIYYDGTLSYNDSSNGNNIFCFLTGGTVYNGTTNSCYVWFYDMNDYNGNCPECEECQDCPEIDTGSILSGACDTNYCVQNDLCPLSSGSRSELMINNIVHEGKPLINISIPDNIYWDYATDDNQFDLYVGSGYNQDYIDSVLAINSYRPDNKDFTNIFVSGLTLIFPYIFVALLIVFIWKLLKRIFK